MPARPPWRDRHPLTLSAVLSAIVSLGAAGGVIWAAVDYLHTDEEAQAHARQDRIRALYQDRRMTVMEVRQRKAEAQVCRAFRRSPETCADLDAEAVEAAQRIGVINQQLLEMQKGPP